MKRRTVMILARVTLQRYNGRTEVDGKSVGNLINDAEENLPLRVNSLEGDLPFKARVISRNIADSAGIQPNTTILLEVERVEDDPQYGEQYRHTAASGNIESPLDILDAKAKVRELNGDTPIGAMSREAHEAMMENSTVAESEWSEVIGDK